MQIYEFATDGCKYSNDQDSFSSEKYKNVEFTVCSLHSGGKSSFSCEELSAATGDRCVAFYSTAIWIWVSAQWESNHSQRFTLHLDDDLGKYLHQYFHSMWKWSGGTLPNSQQFLHHTVLKCYFKLNKTTKLWLERTAASVDLLV